MLRQKLCSTFKFIPVFSTLAITASIMLGSCGYDKTYESREESLYFSQEALAGGVPLTDYQMAVALRVCYAFRSKRSKFTAEMLGQSFNFNYLARDCSSNETTQTFSATLSQQDSSSPLKYSSTFTGNYFRDVQTDTSGYLADLCSDILAGETPLNASEVENELFEYGFRSSVTNGDEVTIQIGSVQSSGATTPRVTQKLVFQVLTNATSSGNYQGMITDAKRYLSCGTDNTNVKLYQQTFTAP